MIYQQIHSATGQDNLVNHLGIVSRVNYNSVIVTLENANECAGCTVKSGCGLHATQLKQIEVFVNHKNFALNEQVTVILKKQAGLKAVFWAYLLPFILMITTLFLASIFFDELFAGIVALMVLIPYYTFIYLNNSKLKGDLEISINKIK